MERRRFLTTGAGAALGATTIGIRAPRPWAPDLVLRGGTVFDGTGSPPLVVDVAVQGDRIITVGTVSETGLVEIQLQGLALAPGFVDIHSHADTNLFINPRAESRIRQGVTLEVVGQDGSSVGPWSEAEFDETRTRFSERYGVELSRRDLGGFLEAIDRIRPTVNVATMVGHGTLRSRVVGADDRSATAEEMTAMRALVRESLEAGAVGLSSGLEYTPGSFADAAELIELCRELQGTGYPYASHIRNEDDRLLAAVEEALHIGRMADVPVQISHLKAQGERNYWKADAALAVIEQARAGGVDVHFDRYPYVAYSTTLANLFPAEARSGGTAAFLARLGSPEERVALERYARDKVALLGSWDAVQITHTRTQERGWARGRRMGELARERGVDPYELAVQLIVEEENGVGMIGFGMSEENTAKILAHPLGMVCSDGGAYAPYGALSEGSPHPRGYGSFPRVLGYYARERGDLSLASAIRKMTGLPARKIRLRDRGVIGPGAYADLVAFDPEAVSDTATFENPHQYPVGLPLVVVNGVITIRDGGQTGERGGRAVRGRGAAGR